MVLPNEFIILSAAIILGALGLCGIVAGWASSRLLGLRWSDRTWLVDAVLAGGVALAVALTIGRLTRGNGPGPSWLALVATLSVVVRHLARRFLGRASARRTS
jgi:CBS-domain-containing membrane protein